MSGALAEGDPNTSTIPLPLDLCTHDQVKSGPDCFCKSVPTGAEKYHGHYYSIQGITAERGENYFQCRALCSDDLVLISLVDLNVDVWI